MGIGLPQHVYQGFYSDKFMINCDSNLFLKSLKHAATHVGYENANLSMSGHYIHLARR